MSNSPPWGEPPAAGRPPQYEPPVQASRSPGTLVCPKCGGTMRTYERNRIQLEQCDVCRGIFLDFGELEALTQLEGQLAAPPPAAYPPSGYPGPEWGAYGDQRYRKRGFGRLFFSS